MEPIPETLAALSDLDAYLDDGSLADDLRRRATLARRVAPDLVAISLVLLEHDITFTLVATDDEVTGIDAVQCVASRPCAELVDEGHGSSTTSEDLLSEDRWHALAQASAAAGAHSTLTLPMVDSGQVIGAVNLYGRSDHTFDNKHIPLAVVFSAWAPGVVTNADLGFTTRLLAEQAPTKLRDDALVDMATGVLAARYLISVEQAEVRLGHAAARANVSVVRLARMIVETKDRDI